ncbi:hypothetical protein ACFPIK_05200 [Algoriphagus aquatilis]|uniref:SGNH/GDSL hydrolase family protein n=1 Tax=Algoriphagus aquatilis TaxID=490186 RepID=A0ABW0BTI0_9BACT
MEKGLFRYFGLSNENKLALVGHSHLMLGVDKLELESQLKQPISKYTREGVNVADRELMVEQLLEENPKLKWVIYGVDAWMFTGEGLSANSYKLFYPFMDQEKIARYVKESTSSQDYVQHKWIKTSRYNEGLINSAMRGHLSNWSNYKLGKVDVKLLEQNVGKGIFRKINSAEENRQIFLRTLKTLKTKGIKVVLVYVPTIASYNQAEPEKFEKELDFFRALDQNNSDVFYLEYLKDWESKHEFFFDPIHLNPEGQKAFTNALSKDLKFLVDDGVSRI